VTVPSTLAFPSPPDVALHWALADARNIVSAQGAVVTARQTTMMLRGAVMTDGYQHASMRLTEQQRAAAALIPWTSDLRSAFEPCDLTIFEFRTLHRIVRLDARPMRPFNRMAIARAFRRMLLAVQREIFALHPDVPDGALTGIRVSADGETRTSLPIEGNPPRYETDLSGRPIANFRAEAAVWLAGCACFSFAASFRWPSAPERLAIESEFLTGARPNGPPK
jgi:hypothetical protein